MQLLGVQLNHGHTNNGKDPTPPELHQAVPQEVTTQNVSTQGDSLDKKQRDSILSSKRISLTRELSDLRRHVNDSMRRENDERFTLVEALGRRLEDERVERGLKFQGQDDRIAEVESSQKKLDLEQKMQSEQIESKHALHTREIEGLGAQIDTLSRKGEVRDNELRELTQRLEETSAECNVKLEESHTRHAEVVKICRKNNEWCSQLEEITQRLETQIAETNTKLDQHNQLDNFETFRDQFEPRWASERKTCQELIEAGVISPASRHQDLSAMFDARIKNLAIRLDAECADRKERQAEQNQVEISRRAREATWEEEISSQKTLIEAESASREQLTQAMSALIALSSERESAERHMQLEDLESRVEIEIKTCADIIQDLRNTGLSNRKRIEELTGSHTQSCNKLESLWDLQRQFHQDVMENAGLEGGERAELFATLRSLVIESADRQSAEMERHLEKKSSEQNAKVDDQNAKIEEQLRAHAELAASHQQLMSAHQHLALLFRSLDNASKKFVSNIAQIEEHNDDFNSAHA